MLFPLYLASTITRNTALTLSQSVFTLHTGLGRLRALNFSRYCSDSFVHGAIPPWPNDKSIGRNIARLIIIHAAPWPNDKATTVAITSPTRVTFIMWDDI
uniref:Uncharacterized protein n=1 Tax=Cacopsylla melanoneura TaxID=428564 RepID=A0A8D9F2C8_9HEMI